ncbi:MAG TPA: hypothetical protein VNW94_03795 [Streptosporangiaceae bacterium]|nr:hypothetical protein [Streptosporangiaceae bacterium]
MEVVVPASSGSRNETFAPSGNTSSARFPASIKSGSEYSATTATTCGLGTVTAVKPPNGAGGGAANRTAGSSSSTCRTPSGVDGARRTV